MLVKAVALSLALLMAGSVIVPLATNTVEAGPRHQRHRKQAKQYKKYSKAWWRQYHARQRRLQALRARKRAMRLAQLRLAPASSDQNAAAPVSTAQIGATLPTGGKAPAGWHPAVAAPGEVQYQVNSSTGDQLGSAAITVVGPAINNASDFARSKSVGGVPVSSLRRDVIDKMIRENGWVVNDYQKEVAGQSVYVVIAQSQSKSGGLQSRMFYFTEVDGKVYSVATNSPVQDQERLAEDSEKVINSLRSRLRTGLRAGLKEE